MTRGEREPAHDGPDPHKPESEPNVATFIYKPTNPNGTDATWRVTTPAPDSKMAQDRDTRTGHKDGILAILTAPIVTRHTGVYPDPFAEKLGKGEVRLTRAQFGDAIVAPVTRYAKDHPNATPADCLAAVLSGPITLYGGRTAGAQTGEAAFASLAGMLAGAIAAARETVETEAASDASTEGAPETEGAESTEGADDAAQETRARRK